MLNDNLKFSNLMLSNQLAALFGTPVVPIEIVAKEFFGITASRSIQNKVKRGEFQKLGLTITDIDEKKYFVTTNDLADFILKSRKQ